MSSTVPVLDGSSGRAASSLAGAVMDWCTRQAFRCARRGRPGLAAQWASIGAETVQHFGHLRFTSPELENFMLDLAQGIPAPPWTARPAGGPRRWMHVMTRVHLSGGHTSLARRWIREDRTGDRHDFVLTDHPLDAVPANLRDVVAAAGGRMTSLADDPDLCRRAAKLRGLACAEADVVVLHVHMWDVIPVVAFGVQECPPVLFVNHADHVHWMGTSVADVVVCVRESGERLTRSHRDVEETFVLPVPLESPAEPSMPSPDARAVARARLGLPSDAYVFLTIGSEYKYRPVGGFGFVAAAEQILEKGPRTRIVAVGPSPNDAQWSQASRRCGGRLVAAGVQLDLRDYLASADAYLEGFPFGSLTALLEGLQAGLPAVRSPDVIPDVMRSDDPAIDDVAMPSPADMDDYVARALAFVERPEAVREIGLDARRRVRDVHQPPGWNERLVELKRRIPTRHQVRRLRESPELSARHVEFHSRFVLGGRIDDALRWTLAEASRLDLRYVVDRPLWRSARAARSAGVRVMDPTWAWTKSRLRAALPPAMWRAARRLAGRA